MTSGGDRGEEGGRARGGGGGGGGIRMFPTSRMQRCGVDVSRENYCTLQLTFSSTTIRPIHPVYEPDDERRDRPRDL